jgi:uncharacterized protein
MKLALFCLATIFVSASLIAQERPTITAQPNTVFVGAEGKFESAPDTALVQFNISAQEETSKAAYDRASRSTGQIREILRSNGIDPKTAEIGFFSIEPVYDWKSPKRKLLGYRVNASVSLKLHDFEKIGSIVQQISDTDVTENQSVSYTLENMESAKTKAVEDGYRRARQSADAVARSSGRTLGDLSYASVDTAEQVRVITPMMPQAGMMLRAQENQAAAPTADFSPQNIVVTSHINAMFTLK